ncbi:hypothetical protein SAMD00019534_041830 [Acytostelium subglobosum LB1]|uniref:hypothetical protein n=1 Tax=Acytostelium subglobosum LB1 TaxID=1410327 RepID=UPI0006450644|nr:hypothetical protein SAMD00019534_041830 [Acytostelium subglobosum LB1]GAM21008.1 hypothetical protein SAMD00019534_041830 [Acytostelium subglobosum LB1]|eukprot:XP_012756142.1 hypothetical protein SAMD00019534_041830 [Acytostelium subglobosum LB1]
MERPPTASTPTTTRMKRNFYEVLGLDPQLSDTVSIKKAYKNMALKYHPDKNSLDPVANQKQFNDIREAYEILSNPELRQNYDKSVQLNDHINNALRQHHHVVHSPRNESTTTTTTTTTVSSHQKDRSPPSSPPQPQQPQQQPPQQANTNNNPFTKLSSSTHRVPFTSSTQYQSTTTVTTTTTQSLDKGNQINSSTTSTLFVSDSKTLDHLTADQPAQVPTPGGSSTSSNIFGSHSPRRQGQSVNTIVRVSFEESIEGCIKTLLYTPIINCPHCKTSSVSTVECTYCGGTKRIQCQHSIKVNVPAGVTNGHREVLSGLGDEGDNGTSAGDLIVDFQVDENTNYKRVGNDVWSDVSISMVQAVLGDRITVSFLYGTMDIDIHPGTQPNQVLKIKDQGFVDMATQRKGDFYIKVVVVIPRTINQQQRQLIREFDKHSGSSNRSSMSPSSSMTS